MRPMGYSEDVPCGTRRVCGVSLTTSEASLATHGASLALQKMIPKIEANRNHRHQNHKDDKPHRDSFRMLLDFPKHNRVCDRDHDGDDNYHPCELRHIFAFH